MCGVCYDALKQVSGVCYGGPEIGVWSLLQHPEIGVRSLLWRPEIAIWSLLWRPEIGVQSLLCRPEIGVQSLLWRPEIGIWSLLWRPEIGVRSLLWRPEIGIWSLLWRPEIGIWSLLWRPERGVRSLLWRPEKGMIFGWSQTNQIAKKLSPVSNSDFLIPIYMNSKGSNHRVEKIKGFENQSLWQIMNSVASENIQSKQKYKWSLNVLCFYYHLSISVPSLFKRAIFLLMCNLSITIFISVFHLSLNVQSSY